MMFNIGISSPKEILEKYCVVSRPKTRDQYEIETLRCRITSRMYTLKKIPDARNVRARMRKLVHPNLVAIHEQMVVDNVLFLVMERMGGDLFSRVKVHGPIAEPLTKFYFYQMALAMHYLHQKVNILHGNLKAQNVLLSAYNEDYCIVKLTDYYHRSKDTDRHTWKKWMTGAYEPPEALAWRSSRPSTHADHWSLGVILFQCLTGWLPVEKVPVEFGLWGKRDCSVVEAFQKDTKVPKRLKPLLTKMLAYDNTAMMEGKFLLPCDITGRMECSELLAHQWFQDGELKKKMNWLITRHKLPDVRPETKGTLVAGLGGDAQCFNEKLR